jgi:polyhydroxyalkanoate synthesis regulator phasin
MELIELLEQGEISNEFARRVIDDLFIQSEPGEAPALRPAVWSAYVESMSALQEQS